MIDKPYLQAQVCLVTMDICVRTSSGSINHINLLVKTSDCKTAPSAQAHASRFDCIIIITLIMIKCKRSMRIAS
jgi:hypothetical protein